MNVAVNQSCLDFVEACVRSGKYANEVEVVQAALELLQGRERLRAAVQEGTDDLDEGRCTEYGPGDFDRFWSDVCAAEEELRQRQATNP